MLITIDGPAGAGKSSVARKLAERLGAAFLDTGAMYRAATLAVMQVDGLQASPEQIGDLVRCALIRVDGSTVWLGDIDVSTAIRAPEVTITIRVVADNPLARQHLSNLQREFARQCGAFDDAWLVTEGRDQGTVVFPDARCKIFLTASARERARRRQRQLLNSGCDVELDQVLVDQTRRDEEDRNRAVGALRAADDATVVYTDGLTEQEVVEQLADLVHQSASLILG